MQQRTYLWMVAALALLLYCNCSTTRPAGSTTIARDAKLAPQAINFWLTKGDQSVLLQKQTNPLFFTALNNSFPDIEVDSSQVFQSIEGFGYSLTGGSAQLINAMHPAAKAALLQELFGNGENSIRISAIRISIGASDLNATAFTYDDLPAGQTDFTLSHFTLAGDSVSGTGLIPLLRKILAINPGIRIMATPWSAPAWMKNNASLAGGSLQKNCYEVYARYFVKYIRQMNAAGIRIDAITPQNEPLNANNHPSMYMTAEQQGDFIKNNLGPAFKAAGINTDIIIYDHNCDRPDYPIAILSDPAAAKFIHGSAFHLYAGDISAMTTVHAAHPNKAVYFTEQYTASTGNFGGDLAWHVKNVLIGSVRNWALTVLEWNLANDPSYEPHTPGGCNTCKGALTIDGDKVTRNVSYYIIAQAAMFIPPGSVRISSTNSSKLYSAAFLRADGKKVLLVLNEDNSSRSFNIKYREQSAIAVLPANSVGTFTW